MSIVLTSGEYLQVESAIKGALSKLSDCHADESEAYQNLEIALDVLKGSA